MKFIQGHTGYKYWLGKKLSAETRKKLSDSHKGKISTMKGKTYSKEVREKMSLGHKKNPTRYWLGKKFSKEYKKKLSDAHKGQIPVNIKTLQKYGKDHHNWKAGITPINEKIRKSLEYKLWRKSVFERDNYICIWCGDKGKKLEADHIKPFALFPELRFAIDNGRTLCKKCHRKTDTWGGRTR